MNGTIPAIAVTGLYEDFGDLGARDAGFDAFLRRQVDPTQSAPWSNSLNAGQKPAAANGSFGEQHIRKDIARRSMRVRELAEGRTVTCQGKVVPERAFE